MTLRRIIESIGGCCLEPQVAGDVDPTSIRLIVAEYPSEIWIGWIRVRTAEVVEDVIGLDVGFQSRSLLLRWEKFSEGSY